MRVSALQTSHRQRRPEESQGEEKGEESPRRACSGGEGEERGAVPSRHPDAKAAGGERRGGGDERRNEGRG